MNPIFLNPLAVAIALAPETGQGAAKPKGDAAAKAETKKAAKANPEAVETIPALVVVGPKEGFRRAGFRFGAEPVVLRQSDISEEQALALQAEPKLLTSVTEWPADLATDTVADEG